MIENIDAVVEKMSKEELIETMNKTKEKMTELQELAREVKSGLNDLSTIYWGCKNELKFR